MPSLDLYYIAIQIAGLFIAFALGMTWLKGSSIRNLSILLGIIVNLFVQIPEGGPGLCLGMIFLPLFFVGAALLGRKLRDYLVHEGFMKRPTDPNEYHPSDPPRCYTCGYLLIGLTGTRCPECGEPFRLPDEPAETKPQQDQPPPDAPSKLGG